MRRNITHESRASGSFPPLGSITRPTVNTAAAAHYVDRRPQTLRKWAMAGSPIAPVRVNGRLAWRVDDIKRLLGIEEAE